MSQTTEIVQISGEIIEEGHEKAQINAPLQVVRVPVKHANLGIRSHAMYISINIFIT